MEAIAYLVSKGHSIDYALSLGPYEQLLVCGIVDAELEREVRKWGLYQG